MDFSLDIFDLVQSVSYNICFFFQVFVATNRWICSHDKYPKL